VLALAFVGLGARAAYVQVFGNDFFQRQGEVRFARTLELPANRGRVLDRNGLILASSVVAQSIWAIPEDVDKSDPKLATGQAAGDAAGRPLRKRLANEDKTFVWVKRQVDEPMAKEIAALGIKGIYQRANTSASIPRARRPHMWWASPTWKTAARKAWNWPSTSSWPERTVRAG
jgi:cell division protein FtsI (penicillin-binding protein 3)